MRSIPHSRQNSSPKQDYLKESQPSEHSEHRADEHRGDECNRKKREGSYMENLDIHIERTEQRGMEIQTQQSPTATENAELIRNWFNDESMRSNC
jgi:hypothetical protein